MRALVNNVMSICFQKRREVLEQLTEYYLLRTALFYRVIWYITIKCKSLKVIRLQSDSKPLTDNSIIQS
jgi:hypothetical protein